MDDDRLVERIARRLRLFDSNADGVVRRRDVLAAAERVVRGFRVPTASIGAERVRAVYEMLSLALVAEFGDVARDEVRCERFAVAVGADPLRRAELGLRMARADAVAVRECLAGVGGVANAEQVAEVVVALGAHPGHAPVIRRALERDGALIPLAAVERPFAAYFDGMGCPGLYGPPR
ncbi:hypothetical protein ACFFSW_06195 [Saccharothrix longispora]|uniref:EF-hand domain-containing protein n=1 Tax=Saccharothrix longispora TaxID=33920 RepID=A0ABU1PTE0_9PSEU|nr:hypothetical protein [Saccharothrix longispora]MDR6593913.1 hypothetical protein [Saccharothrix longispora]